MIHKGKHTEGIIIEGVKKIPNKSFFIMGEHIINEDDIILGESLSHILDVGIRDKVIVTPLINTPKN